jgi:hypothetical protein
VLLRAVLHRRAPASVVGRSGPWASVVQRLVHPFLAVPAVGLLAEHLLLDGAPWPADPTRLCSWGAAHGSRRMVNGPCTPPLWWAAASKALRTRVSGLRLRVAWSAPSAISQPQPTAS